MRISTLDSVFPLDDSRVGASDVREGGAHSPGAVGVSAPITSATRLSSSREMPELVAGRSIAPPKGLTHESPELS